MIVATVSMRVISLRGDAVKSMGGEALGAATRDSRGVEGDRWYAVEDAEGHFASGKDTPRFRRRDQVFSYAAATDPSGHVIVAGGHGRWTVGDAALDEELSRAMGLDVRVTPEADAWLKPLAAERDLRPRRVRRRGRGRRRTRGRPGDRALTDPECNMVCPGPAAGGRGHRRGVGRRATLAGVGDVFLDAWQHGGHRADLDFALRLAEALVERAQLSGEHAWWHFVEHRAEPPLLPPGVGWMQGAAGIAAYLFRVSRVLEHGRSAAAVPRLESWWAGRQDEPSH